MPVRHIAVSTSTGVFPSTDIANPVPYVDLGDAYHRFAYAGASSADKDYAATVEGSLGNSGVWTTVLTLTTSNSTGIVESTGSISDKLRVTVTTNNTTAESGIWLAATD